MHGLTQTTRVPVQVAVQHVDGLTFNLLNQTKIMFNAVFLYVILGKRQSTWQVAALLGLVFAGLLLGGDAGACACATHHCRVSCHTSHSEVSAKVNTAVKVVLEEGSSCTSTQSL